MATSGRVGTGLLGGFGLALAGLMGYTLAYQGCAGPGPSPPPEGRAGSSGVAVFFPDREDWDLFRRAVEACARRGLCRAGATLDDSIVVSTPRLGRRVRFAWHGTRGVGEVGAEAGRVARREPPPVAVVGSTTTVQTVALAEALRDAGPGGPVLLVPWATAVRAGGPRPGSRPAPLLEIDAGRTFRFCADNRRLAESVVDCLLERDGRPPGRAYLVVDPLDPYSVDLADCFRRAIGARAPAAEVVERFDAVGIPTMSRSSKAAPTPSMAEAALADAAWTAAEAAPDGRTTWVVLPLQNDPARRMLAALQSRSSWRASDKGEGPLRVVAGDGIGREALEAPPGRRAFSIWSASTSSACPPGLGVTDETQTFAEVASAILRAVEEAPGPSPTPDQVRDALARLDLPGSDPSAFGRPLGFAPGGERRDAPGCVLASRPGIPGVVEYGRAADGRWATGGGPGASTSKGGP